MKFAAFGDGSRISLEVSEDGCRFIRARSLRAHADVYVTETEIQSIFECPECSLELFQSDDPKLETYWIDKDKTKKYLDYINSSVYKSLTLIYYNKNEKSRCYLSELSVVAIVGQKTFSEVFELFKIALSNHQIKFDIDISFPKFRTNGEEGMQPTAEEFLAGEPLLSGNIKFQFNIKS